MRAILEAFCGYYLSVLLHEIAHALVSEWLGLRVKAVRFKWGAVAIERPAGPPLSNLLISLAGPAMNVLLAWSFLPYFPTFALANFCIGLGNLLPMPGSDGERALRCMADIRLSQWKRAIAERGARELAESGLKGGVTSVSGLSI
jgi:Zn-dependent protease